jgi:hypothetical protein
MKMNVKNGSLSVENECNERLFWGEEGFGSGNVGDSGVLKMNVMNAFFGRSLK